MKPAERILTTVAHREPDRVPVVLWTSPPVLEEFAGISSDDFFGSRQKQLEAKLAFQRRFLDALCPNFVPEWRKLPFATALEESGVFQGKLQVPDFHASATAQEFLEWWRYFYRHIDPEIAAVWGPLSWQLQLGQPTRMLQEHLGNLSQFFVRVKQDRRFVHELCPVLTEAAIAWVNMADDFCREEGFSYGVLMMATDIVPMLSPEWADEFMVPYTRPVFEASSAPLKVFHFDLDITHMSEVMVRLGCNVFDFNFCPVPRLKREIGDRVCLQGNVNAVEVLADGTPTLVEQAARLLIYQAGHGGGYILKTGGGLSTGTPWENVDALIRSAEEYGNYPLPAPPPAEDEEPEEKGHTRAPTKTHAIHSTGLLGDIARAVFQGDAQETQALVQRALPHFPPQRILGEGLAEGVRIMAEKHHLRETFFPELVMADRALEHGLEVLLPYFTDRDFCGCIVIGAVRPNIHEMGIKVVGAMLRSVGFAVHSIGVNRTAEEFLEAAHERRADIIALGVYTRQGLPVARRLSGLIKEQGLSFRTLTGGRGISPIKATECGLDAYGEDASEAIVKAQALIASVNVPSARNEPGGRFPFYASRTDADQLPL